MIFTRFLGFGKELRWPFEVHAACYDCADFYDGCKAWPASKRFTCDEYNRLPDVMPGTCGQRFPATRHRNERPAERQAPEKKHRRAGPRVCQCGVTLPKNRRLCDSCRVANRRATMREAKRRYRAALAASQPGSDVPLAPRRHALRGHQATISR